MNFIAKTWNNGSYHNSGAGFGLKVRLEDREQFFNRSWQTVTLHLNGYAHPIEVNVGKPSFWNQTCGELINKHIGLWLQQNNRATWPNGQPHQVLITVVRERVFNVELI